MVHAILVGLIGALVGGGLAVLIATTPDDGEILITSDQPITAAQVQEKLRSEGSVNIQSLSRAAISKSPPRRTANPER